MIAARYLIIVSDMPAADAHQIAALEAATGLSLAIRTPRMCILVDDTRHSVPLETGEGAFIGTVFTTAQRPIRVESVSRAQSHGILSSDGRSVLENSWGAYVLATECAHHDKLAVARDPSGILPCYSTRSGELQVFASDVETMVRAGLVAPVIDYPALLRHLVDFDLPRAETCLAGVVELLPGMRAVSASGSWSHEMWWSPWASVGQPLDEPPHLLAARLRDTIDRCASGWEQCSFSAILSLSGGLDSSIVACALRRAGGDIAAYNMVGDDADGDERDYAWQVAQALDIELELARYDPEVADLDAPSAGHLPRPVGTIHMQPFDAAARALADRKGASLSFNGLGGDSIFGSVRSALPVADSIAARRSPRATLQTARNVARLCDSSLLQVFGQAVRMAIFGRRPLKADGVKGFLSQNAEAMASPTTRSPWLERPETAPPGKTYHVEMIARVQAFVEGFDRWQSPISVAFLFSQPILELCLRIPSWAWVSGGIDRSIARLAFTGILPTKITERRSKGGPNAMSLDMCLQNLDELKARLLNGELCRRGYLDTGALEAALERPALVYGGYHRDLLILADVEAWISHWVERGRSFQRVQPVDGGHSPREGDASAQSHPALRGSHPPCS